MLVHRLDRSQVDHLSTDAFGRELAGGLHTELDGVRRPDDRHIAAPTAVDPLPDGHAVKPFRNNAVLPHQPSMLEHAHGIVVEEAESSIPWHRTACSASIFNQHADSIPDGL